MRAQFSFGHYMLVYDSNGKVLANFRESWGTMMFRTFYSVFYLYVGESDVLIARAERSTFLNSELKWLAAVKGEDCDDSDAHNNCRLLAVDEYKMQWRFIWCGGYPWNFAWVDMPSNPVARMAIQASACSLPPVCLRACTRISSEISPSHFADRLHRERLHFASPQRQRMPRLLLDGLDSSVYSRCGCFFLFLCVGVQASVFWCRRGAAVAGK